MRSLENEREGRIRPAAAGPRRLRVSTGHSLRAAFRIRPPNTHTTKKTSSYELVFFVVGEDGFEPSKRYAADLQSVPFGHSGTPPYLICLEPVDGLEPPTY